MLNLQRRRSPDSRRREAIPPSSSSSASPSPVFSALCQVGALPRISIFSLQREFELLRRDAKIGEEEEGEEFNPSFVFHGFSIGFVFFCSSYYVPGDMEKEEEEEEEEGPPNIRRRRKSPLQDILVFPV